MSKIIKGYKGVMDLDLTNVNPSFHKSLIQQHMKDIDEYRKEQASLKEESRYDNTIGTALRKMEYYNRITAKRFFNPDKYN